MTLPCHFSQSTEGRDIKTYIQTKAGKQTCTAAFLASTHREKQPKRPGEMDKQTVVCPYRGLQLGNRETDSTDTRDNMDGSQMHFAKWKEAICMAFWRRPNIGTEHIVVAKGCGGKNLPTDVQQEESSGGDGNIPCG